MKIKKSKILFYIINFLIVILVSSLTIYKIIDENGQKTFLQLKELSVLSIIILTMMFLVNYFIEGIIISISLKGVEENFSTANGFVVQSVGGLFSAITPLKSGYLPSVAYTYAKYGVKGNSIIKSMAKTSFAYQFVCLLISVASVIMFSVNNKFISIGEMDLSLLSVSLVGFIYNIVLIVGYFILILSPTLHKLVIKIIAWILSKLGKMDDKKIFVDEKIYKMSLIRGQIKGFFKDIKQFVLLSLLYIFKILFFSGLPYIGYLLLTNAVFSLDTFMLSIILCNLISYITNIIPIPGASGAAEVAFMGVFAIVFPSSVLTSVMLVWRMFSYFINIIVGFIVFIIILNYKKKSKDKIIE